MLFESLGFLFRCFRVNGKGNYNKNDKVENDTNDNYDNNGDDNDNASDDNNNGDGDNAHDYMIIDINGDKVDNNANDYINDNECRCVDFLLGVSMCIYMSVSV